MFKILIILFSFFLLFTSCSKKDNSGSKAPVTKKIKHEPFETFKIPEIKVNLKNRSGIVLLDLALAYQKKNEKFVKELTDRKFQLKDLFISQIREKTHKEMLEEETMLKIKENLKEILNKILLYGQVNDIYIYNYNLIGIQ